MIENLRHSDNAAFSNRRNIEVIIEIDHTKSKPEFLHSLATIKCELPMIQSYIVSVSSEQLLKLKTHPAVKNIHAVSNISAQMNTASQVVNCKGLHENGITGRGIGIAILDTGISPMEDFCIPENRLVAFRDFVYGKKNPYDNNGHGTHVTRPNTKKALKVPMYYDFPFLFSNPLYLNKMN